MTIGRMVHILKFINSRLITDKDKLSAIQTVIIQYTPIDKVTKTDLINVLKWLFEYVIELFIKWNFDTYNHGILHYKMNSYANLS